MKRPQRFLLPVIILLLGLTAFCIFPKILPGNFHIILPSVICFAALVLLILTWKFIVDNLKQQRAEKDNIFAETRSLSSKIANDLSVPCLLMNENGSIVWRNDAMTRLSEEKHISRILSNYNLEKPPFAANADLSGSSYIVYSMPVNRKTAEKNQIFQYWVNHSDAVHYQRLYEENRPNIALIYVDNIEELETDQQFRKTSVLAEVEHLVADTASSLNGTYRRVDNDRFMIIFESKELKKLEESKFSLLDAAHSIDTGTHDLVSLSISVGVGDSVSQSDDSAKQAMELALGRGGDQAVVKCGSNYSYYGGKHQLTSTQSRVKTRLFSRALRQLFEAGGNVIVMGHKNADMDCFGSALAIAACAKLVDAKPYIVLDQVNETIDIVVEATRNSGSYNNCVITPEQAERIMQKSNCTLVVVDTQRAGSTMAPQLLKLAPNLVLIDHHRRSADYIDTSTLHLLESKVSSTSELVTEVIQYYDENPKIPPFICSALLAGITVDTKHFAFNVSSRTFEAAGYLRKNGADPASVQQMFRDDMSVYSSCADAVRSAEILPGNIALTRCDQIGIEIENEKLVAAKAADQLINIRGYEAGFALGRDASCIYVSGRSLGSINVQLICEKLGGGGHMTMSGAQLNDMTMDEAYSLVKKTISEYAKEVNKQ